MTFLISTAMVISLIAIIVLLLSAIVYLHIQFYKEKQQFKIRLIALRKIISELTNTQDGQIVKLQLSDALDESLKSGNAKLNDDIFQLNFEIFDILSKNNLLKK